MQRKMFGGHDVADKAIEYQLLRRNQTDAAKSLKHIVIQIVSEESREHKVDATEILPPFGRLNDTKEDFH